MFNFGKKMLYTTQYSREREREFKIDRGTTQDERRILSSFKKNWVVPERVKITTHTHIIVRRKFIKMLPRERERRTFYEKLHKNYRKCG